MDSGRHPCKICTCIRLGWMGKASIYWVLGLVGLVDLQTGHEK